MSIDTLPGHTAAAARLTDNGDDVLRAFDTLQTGLTAEQIKTAVLPSLFAQFADALPGRLGRKDALMVRLCGRAFGVALTVAMMAVEADRERRP